MKSDLNTMKTLNIQSTSARSNVFAIAKTNANKAMLKKTVTSVLENIKKNQLKYDAFIPYFHWLIQENDLESIKRLFEVFEGDKRAITKFMTSRLPDKRNIIALCTMNDANVDVLEFFIDKIRDKDLRKMLMDRNENDKSAIQSMSKKCESVVLKYVMKKDKNLLKDVLCENEWGLLIRHVDDKDELKEIFTYCDGRVLNDEAINLLLTQTGWSNQGNADEIRTIIMEKGKEFGVSEKSMYSHVDPVTGNSALFSSLIKGNERQFGAILASFDLDNKDTIEQLIGFKNYHDQNLLHAACQAPDDRLKYCQAVLELCQFQEERESMLLAQDIDGNNPLQLFLSKVWYYDRENGMYQ